MSDPGFDLSALERLLGDVLVEGEIARTPRAVVYRIRRAGGTRPLALKVASAASDAEDLARFRHEVRLLSESRHPNVIHVEDFGVLPGGRPFLTMERVVAAGRDRWLRAGWRSFYELALEAASGLAHIHRQRVMHLDVKPRNLGLGEADGRLKLLDFGLAQPVIGPGDRRIRGTLAYMAPEILRQDRYDHRADLYSLGMTLFELATGVLPSAGGDREAMRFHLEGGPPDPLALVPDLPPALGALLLRLLERDPGNRYPSAGRLLADLGEASGLPVEIPAAEGALLASPLIGREDALDRLRGALAEAQAGRGGAVRVEGGPGAGKSRLLRELRLFARIEGVRVGSAFGTAGRSRPLEPFLEALASAGVEVAPGPEARGEPAPRERFQLFGNLARALATAAQAGPPLLLLLDDLHKAGAESQALLHYLAGELREARVLVVAAARPLPGPARDPESSLQEVSLAPVRLGDTTRLVDAALGSRGLLPQLYGWIHERSRGAPGEVGPLLRQLVENRVLLYRDGEWKPSLPALTRWASLPVAPGEEKAEEEDGARLSSLPAAARSVLEAAAVFDGPFSLEALGAVLEEDLEGVYEHLQALAESGFLESSDERGGVRYVLSQARVQSLLARRVEAGRGALLHRRLGFWLAANGGPAAMVAEHLWQGGERAASVPHLLQAAQEARAVYGHAEAAAFLSRAAEVTPAAEILLRLAEALAAAGQFARAAGIYQDLSAKLGSPQAAARAHLERGRLLARLGEPEAALASHDEGLRVLADPAGGGGEELAVDLLFGRALALRDLGDAEASFSVARAALERARGPGLERQRASLLNALGMLAAGRGDWRRARRLVGRGLWVAESAGDETLSLTLRNNLGNLLWKTGDFEGAATLYRRNLELCERTRDLWGELNTLNNLGILECSRGNWQAAREPLARSLEIKRRLGLAEKEALAHLNLGEVEEVLGNWGRAERHYERALRLLAVTADPRERFAALLQRASLDRRRGQSEAARERAEEALAGAARLGDQDLLAQGHHLLGQIEKDLDRGEAARDHLGQALQIAVAAGSGPVLARVHVALADLASRSGDLAGAGHHAGEARRLAESQGDRFTLARLDVIEGILAAERDEVELAERRFAAGVRALEETGAPFEHARALYEWGVRTWNLEIALRRLREALVIFERLGATTESRRTRAAVERLRDRLGTGAGEGAHAVLGEVSRVVNSTLDLQEVLHRTLDLVLGRLGAERGMIVLANRITRELEIAAVRDVGREDEDEGRQLSESVVRRVIETREPVLAVDALTDGRFAGSESIVARHILSILCVPLAIRDRLAGALYVDHRQSRHLFGPADLELLTAVADQAAIAIENARLYGEIDAARERLKAENEALRREVLARHDLGSLVGRSRAMAQLKQMLEKVAQNPSTVLVRGESGTGKGLVARVLHAISPRRQAPFIHFNCAALPETLVESELFGHEKGAFTGAAGQKPGRFELAHQGTIFLDEIGKVSLAVQSKLLRVVEEKEFERVGGTRTLKSDVRVVAATNLDLEDAVRRNQFREDLFYRLNIIPIVLPPLRERLDDIPFLVDHFLSKLGRELGRPAQEIDPAVLDLFAGYSWPGNVRELEAALHRAFVLSEGDTLRVEDFDWIRARPSKPVTTPAKATTLQAGGYEQALERYDRQLIATALSQCGGRIRETARLLGIARNTLRAKMKKYGLQGMGD